SFFSAAEGWGTLSQTRRGKRQESAIKVVYGKLMLRELTLRVPEGVSAPKATAHLANKAVEARVVVARGQAQLAFRQPVTVAEGQTLSVRLSWA
ncbi:hypothetical protein FJY63_00435, partial [Candidatus Sumerlaeota bacterium]|nr:hypothetical protein [Candidatus Sumerlaeota bacterium]